MKSAYCPKTSINSVLYIHKEDLHVGRGLRKQTAEALAVIKPT